ncbi:MAG: hypothetical protein GWN58_17655 [Anaerolineae bacterium]|nr:hypothetical protein [Anaerolineae bacterium]
MSSQLPCGCIRGQFLCSEAERLWRRSSDAYETAKLDFEDEEAYNEYMDRLEEYNRHFEETEDDGTDET